MPAAESTNPPDRWEPQQYERFKDERSQPFYDLLRLVRLPLAEPRAGEPGAVGAESPAPTLAQAVDLGCGTGELTRVLFDHLATGGPLRLVALDSSAAMLAESAQFATPGLEFRQALIEDFAQGTMSSGGRPPAACMRSVESRTAGGAPTNEAWSLIFSNAALQWVPDHARLLPRLGAQLAPGGQLAVQVPCNDDHPAYELARTVARREPFATALGGFTHQSPVLPPEWYARALHACGLSGIEVYLRVYTHLLSSPAMVAEWAKGTVLNHYLSRLSPELGAQYFAEYREQLVHLVPDERPYLFTFKRLFITGIKL